MKLSKIVLFLVSLFFAGVSMAQKNVYKFEIKDGAGKNVKLKAYKGKVLLIVNTATRCGFTPQYEDLERLYTTYQAQGFEVLDFPCNQFGAQAPGSYNEIHRFCSDRFGITFPQFGKIDVNGNNALPLYTYLKAQAPFKGFDLTTDLGKKLDDLFRKDNPNYTKDPSIKWNFTKFLIDRNGHVIDRFEPSDDMQKVEKGIKAALQIK